MSISFEVDRDYQPTDVDFLIGRGKAYYNSAGNQFCRGVLRAEFAVRYNTAAERGRERTAIAAEAVQSLRSRGTKFLKVDEDISRWVLVDDGVATLKTSRAIRDLLNKTKAKANVVHSNSRTVDQPQQPRITRDQALLHIEERLWANMGENQAALEPNQQQINNRLRPRQVLPTSDLICNYRNPPSINMQSSNHAMFPTNGAALSWQVPFYYPSTMSPSHNQNDTVSATMMSPIARSKERRELDCYDLQPRPIAPGSGVGSHTCPGALPPREPDSPPTTKVTNCDHKVAAVTEGRCSEEQDQDDLKKLLQHPTILPTHSFDEDDEDPNNTMAIVPL